MARRTCYSLRELATLSGSRLLGEEQLLIDGGEVLQAAQPSHISFLSNPAYLETMRRSQSGAICISESLFEQVKDLREKGRNFLLCTDPSLTFQSILALFHDPDGETNPFPGIHPTAVIDPSASIGSGVTIGPNCVVGPQAVLEEGVVLIALVFVGAQVHVGQATQLHPGVIVREGSRLGKRVILQPGVVIGSCGFGYSTDHQTGRHTKLPQQGIVILEDDVEVGANTTIDRARLKSKATLIGRGTKIDNQVQIAHNVEVGTDVIVVAQTGIAGSTKLGPGVILGGQVGVVGHIELAAGVKVTAKGGVSKSLSKPGIYGGRPARLFSEHQQQQVHLRRLGRHIEQMKRLEQRVKELEQTLHDRQPVQSTAQSSETIC